MPPATTQATTTAPTTTAATRQFIGADRAKAIALAKVPGATVDHIHDFELDNDDDDRDDRPEYEGEIKYDGYEYEFEIDAYTGEITEWEVERDGRSQAPATTKTPETTARQRISRDRAIQIALAQVPGATTKHVEDVDMDDDEIEIEIEYNNYEYEFEIHPWTGEILDMEVEYDD